MKKTDKGTELKIIESYNLGNSMKAIGLDFGVSPVTVKNILDRNGIQKRTSGGIYKLPDEEIINKYKSGLSCNQIASEYKVTFHTISKILEKHNIKRDNIYHNLELIEDYWENIDSFDKAYFLGFLLTDGNITGNQVKLELSAKDEQILHTFNYYTKSENKIINLDRGDKGKFCAFSVKRKKWTEDLSNYGIKSNKTFTTEMPVLSDDLMPHLIRGMIDGDGWITYKGHQIGFCGSEKCVTQLRDYLVRTLRVYSVKIIHQGTNVWQVCWCNKKDIKTIGDFIYNEKQDCFLERKYNNFLKLIHDNTEVTTETKESVAP